MTLADIFTGVGDQVNPQFDWTLCLRAKINFKIKEKRKDFYA
jgi:hypothetical protein